jgi:hypothetical protein
VPLPGPSVRGVPDSRQRCLTGITVARVKATPEVFARALAPVLADLDRQHPGVLRLTVEPEGSEVHAWLVNGEGWGTGLLLGDGWDTDADAVVELADKVQEAAIEALWLHTGNSTWPSCPEHPDGAPLGPVRHEGEAFWFCPYDRRAIAKIGALGIL